jgi:hypothetical protein
MAKHTSEPLACDAFAFTFRVKFDDFHNDYPMLVTTENNTLQCHGLGPAYHGDRGRIGLYIYTKSGKGQHGRGIEGTRSGSSLNQGWVKSVPLRTGVWHDVRVVKTRRTLSIAVDNELVEETLPASLTDSDFDMKDPGRTVVGGGIDANTALHGTITDFVIESTAAPVGEGPPPYSPAAAGTTSSAVGAAAAPPAAAASAARPDVASMTLVEKAAHLQKHLGLAHSPLQETAAAAAAAVGVDVSAYGLREQIDRLVTILEG